MMNRRKFNNLQLQLSSSVLYYDREEMENFFKVYDTISSEPNIVLDAPFVQFVKYLHGFDDFVDDAQQRKMKIIEWVRVKNEQNPNVDSRDAFEIWMDQAAALEMPMELSDDIFHHFLWEEFKNTIIRVDKSDMPFKDKLAVRPKAAGLIHDESLVSLDDIDFTDEVNSDSFSTGLEELDKVVKWNRTDFVVIGARPGVGKSTMMLNAAIVNAMQGVKCIYFSFEMGKRLIGPRIINYLADSNLRDEHTDEDGILDTVTYQKSIDAIKRTNRYKMVNENLKIYVSKSPNAESVFSEIENQIKKGHYDIVFVDYLQLLRFHDLDQFASIRESTPVLKSIAFRNNVLMVTASQVSRASSERGLYLGDLFGSSTIEADTDTVLGIEKLREAHLGTKCLLNVKVMKQRNGKADIDMRYEIDYSTGKMQYNSETGND
jgi:KaiC/GvpD/RAD55 family RecA-like ATPase